jgi:hypothetical protein
MSWGRVGIGLAVAGFLGACNAATVDRASGGALELVPSIPPAPMANDQAAAVSLPGAAAGETRGGQLVGLSAGEVTRLLGLPRSLRHEPPAEVWQYASASCVMFVFLYEGQPGRGSSARDWRVNYIETRSRADGKPVSLPDCLSGLIDRRPLALGEG